MGEGPIDARALANYILVVRWHFGLKTTNLELQKIAYFAYGKYLLTYGEKLCDGYFEAWEHGPVHPVIYREFKHFGAAPITNRAEAEDIVTGEKLAIRPPTDAQQRAHIAETVLQLRGLTASQLREKSHAKGGPWHRVWSHPARALDTKVIIPDTVIREDFNRHILLAPSSVPVEETSNEDHKTFDDRRR